MYLTTSGNHSAYQITYVMIRKRTLVNCINMYILNRTNILQQSSIIEVDKRICSIIIELAKSFSIIEFLNKKEYNAVLSTQLDHPSDRNEEFVSIDIGPDDATLKEELDYLEKKYGVEAAKKEYARRASSGVSALDPGMAARVQAIHSLAAELETMTLKQRQLALGAHYAAQHEEKKKTGEKIKTWEEARSDEPTPNEFVAWLDKTYPDRCAVGLMLSDMKHLDKPAYIKVIQWSQRKSKIPKATIDGFGLPRKKQLNDKLLATEGAPTGAQVFEAFERGDPRARVLHRRSAMARSRQRRLRLG